MNNILTTILLNKEKEVATLKELYPNGIKIDKAEQTSYSFIKKLQRSSKIEVISEIKRGSPSKGLFAPELDIKAQASKYQVSGAGGISILTDEKYFYGSFEDIKDIRPLVDLPILCKDFIIDEIQIDMAKSIGANIILLIVAAHKQDRLIELLEYAKTKDMEVLIEVHDKAELDFALTLNHPLIGVNNRNLKTFETTIQTSLDLIQHANNPDLLMISESGIKTVEDVELLAKAGFKGVLIGESLIRNGIDGTLMDQISKISRC